MNVFSATSSALGLRVLVLAVALKTLIVSINIVVKYCINTRVAESDFINLIKLEYLILFNLIKFN